MDPTPARVVALTVIPILLSACGGGGAPPPPSASSAAKAAGSSPAAVSLAPSAQPPAATPSPATKPAGASASPAAAAPGASLACSLASPADVSAAFGEQFGDGTPSSPGGTSACLWKLTGGGIDTVNLVVATGPQADTFYNTNKAAYTSTDVSGLGDKAFVSKELQIGVERGGVTYLTHLVGFENQPVDAVQAKEKAFMQTVLSHAK
ncbi:MAG TPA: hypothetical protein VF157_10670 [Chloroflexota bacterium]